MWAHLVDLGVGVYALRWVLFALVVIGTAAYLLSLYIDTLAAMRSGIRPLARENRALHESNAVLRGRLAVLGEHHRACRMRLVGVPEPTTPTTTRSAR